MLDNFTQTMRPYQQGVIDDALSFLAQTQEDLDVLPRRLWTLPTGTGKGSLQLALLRTLRDNGVNAWILSPALEVLRGCLQRCGITQCVIDEASAEKLAALGESIYVTTPMRCQNRALEGASLPDVVIYDEAHHAIEGNEVSGTLFALAPDAVWLGFTATPFRGTPRGTAALREAWGEPQVVLTIPEAIHAGYMACPTFRVVPLVDDDTIAVVNGAFQAKASGNRVKAKGEEIAALVRSLVIGERWGEECSGFPVAHDMPTVLIVPDTSTAGSMVEVLDAHGVSARMVIGTTKTTDRALAYRECEAKRCVIVCVAVLSEGVDFPWLGRIIDARPTTSPVEFVQRIGRVMRPKSFTPEYVTVTRNLERFAYLMGGAVPPETVGAIQQAFPTISKRDGARTLGFEALARFKRIPYPIAGGLRGSMFNVHTFDYETGMKTDWCILTSPLSERTIVATKTTATHLDEQGLRLYSDAKWLRASLPDDLSGFATSQQTGPLSDKQRQWWERAASRHGLDPNAAGKLKRREFQVLPVLSNLGTSVQELS